MDSDATCLNYIKSYCQIVPGCIWLNGKEFFKTNQNPVVMDDFFNAVYKHAGINYRKFFKMDALSKLGFIASEILLAGIDREQPKPDMGIILFNKSSSLDADLNFQVTIKDKENFFPSPKEFVYTLPNIVTGEIAIRNKIYGETVFHVMSHFAGDTICWTIDDALLHAGIKYALAGWVEVDAFKKDFNCLMMLCTSDQGKKEIEKNESYLPYDPDEFDDLDFDNVRDLYREIKNL